MENDESAAMKMTVFGKPNFGDPTLFEKKHEVLGYYVQKWKTGDYGMFQPEYAVLPQAAAKIYDPGNVLRYYMVEHCPAKAALSGTMGYALGGFLGLFMHGAEQSAAPAKGLRAEWNMMKGSMHRSGKNFGTIGMMFAGTECVLDGYRGWHDWTTSPTTGFIVGGAMGLRAGIKPGLFGGLGFAVFSYVIDKFMGFH